MSDRAPVAWVVAGEDTAARWVAALRGVGFAAGALAWSAARSLDPGAAATAACDLVLFTSRHAPQALASESGVGRPAACVGAATAAAARARGFDVVLVGEAGGAALARSLRAEQPAARRVLFLAGADARREAVEVLRADGVTVQTVPVYAMEPRGDFGGRVAGAPDAAVVVLGSPRAAEALAGALAGAERSLPPGAFCAALGAVTAERAAALFDRYVARAEHAAPAALAAAVRAAWEERGA